MYFPQWEEVREGEELTNRTLKFTSHFRFHVGKSQTEFSFKGNTLRQFIPALLEQFDIADLLLEGDEHKPYVRVVINWRVSYTIGGWEAKILDGGTLVLLHSYAVVF